MYTEIAATRWGLAAASPPCPSSPAVPAPLAVVETRARHLTLHRVEDAAAPGAADRASLPAPGAGDPATPSVSGGPAAEGDGVTPLAASLAETVGALLASPASLVGLLAAASEQRRVLELIWTGCEIGALQLPPAVVARIEDARAHWPQALPV